MATGQVGEYPVGSLVRIRERDWVVLPSDDADILCLRPLSGSEAEICGIHRAIEGSRLQHAEFAPPVPEQAGDFIAGKLLRNAARLGLRNGAGPFRSLGRLSVRPRPYQFVPLIMALKLDTVRMLIADDVGVGKPRRNPTSRLGTHSLVICPFETSPRSYSKGLLQNGRTRLEMTPWERRRLRIGWER